VDISFQPQKLVASPQPVPSEDFRQVAFGFAKRAIDILASALLLLFFLPLMILLVLAIKLDGHPAFYNQARLGLDGKEFRIWKFRSMVSDADRRLAQHLLDPAVRQEWDCNQKLVRDPRITRIGRFIRKYSLDELPQLWNVLRGDMSLIGPRPMMPEQRALYPGDACFKVRPGITGLWQVSERNASTFADRARYDDFYAANLSVRMELLILFKTVGVVLRGTGC
jgi:lipopolysaccharide/colanic/teichoic acid biosynthesis glycosyltransferase